MNDESRTLEELIQPYKKELMLFDYFKKLSKIELMIPPYKGEYVLSHIDDLKMSTNKEDIMTLILKPLYWFILYYLY